jgi:hypothetical protein
MLDEQGFADASRAISEALDRISRIERESKRRLRGHDGEVPAVVIAMLFDAPQEPGQEQER